MEKTRYGYSRASKKCENNWMTTTRYADINKDVANVIEHKSTLLSYHANCDD